MGKTVEEMQRAVDLYQSELVKLQQRAMMAAAAGGGGTSPGGGGGLPTPPPPSSSAGSVASGHASPGSRAASVDAVEAAAKEAEDAAAKEDRKPSPVQDFKLGAGPLQLPGAPPGFFPPPPVPPTAAAAAAAAAAALTGGGGGGNSLEEKLSSTSPLQGMASITNSLTNQPLPAPYRPAQRSLKAILPPITQEQFDQYNNINTEELVRTVGQKDTRHLQSKNTHFFSGEGNLVPVFNQPASLWREHPGTLPGKRVRSLGQAKAVPHADPEGEGALHQDETLPGG